MGLGITSSSPTSFRADKPFLIFNPSTFPRRSYPQIISSSFRSPCCGDIPLRVTRRQVAFDSSAFLKESIHAVPARENFSNFLKKKRKKKLPCVCLCVGIFQFYKGSASLFNRAQSYNFLRFSRRACARKFAQLSKEIRTISHFSDVLPRASAVNEHESAYCNTIELLNNNS